MPVKYRAEDRRASKKRIATPSRPRVAPAAQVRYGAAPWPGRRPEGAGYDLDRPASPGGAMFEAIAQVLGLSPQERRPRRRSSVVRPRVELLEERLCPTNGTYLRSVDAGP